MAKHHGVARFDREGRLVSHGHADIHGRPDAVQFVGRSGETFVDAMAELTVTIDRWPTRTGVAVLLEATEGGGWEPIANALPFDAIYVTKAQPARLVFSAYVPLIAGRLYRLHLPGAVLVSPTVHVVALLWDREQVDTTRPRRRTRAVRHAAATASTRTPATPATTRPQGGLFL